MNLNGERTLPGKPDQIWRMLLDPDVLVSAIPGCEELEKVEEDHYTGVISAKVGSIQSTYNATFKISEKDPPNSYVLNVQGQGSAGFVKGDVKMEMAPEGSAETTLTYSGTANVGGRIAQVGQRMVKATADAMIDQGFEDLRDRIQREVDLEDAREAARAEGAGEAETAAEQAAESASQERKKGLLYKIGRAFRFLRTFFKSFFGGSSS
jgi:carbon monoxide dehydrogenase subunit G